MCRSKADGGRRCAGRGTGGGLNLNPSDTAGTGGQEVGVKELPEQEAINLLGMDFGDRTSAALNPETPPELLAVLAGDEVEDIREAVANNENTPPEILAVLAGDEHWWVREAVANNENTPPEILAALAGDEVEDIREAVAYNGSTPPEILAVLAGDEIKEVREAVAENPVLRERLSAELNLSSDLPVEWRERLIDSEIRERYGNI